MIREKQDNTASNNENKKVHREPLTSDLVFKAVFGSETEESKQALIGLLNHVLNRKKNPIVDIEYLNPFSINENIHEKYIIMDIKIKTADGEMIDTEMQIGELDEYIKRSIYYGCKQLVHELLIGDRYEKLKPSIVISFIKGKLFPERDGFYSSYSPRENEDGEQLTDLLGWHYIELGKIDWSDRDVTKLTPLEQIGAYLKCSGEQKEADFVDDLVEHGTEVIGMADNVLLRVSEDERIQAMRDSREMFLLQQHWERENALNKGRAEGHLAGKSEANKEAARRLKARNVPMDIIAECTGLPLEYVDAI